MGNYQFDYYQDQMSGQPSAYWSGLLNQINAGGFRVGNGQYNPIPQGTFGYDFNQLGQMQPGGDGVFTEVDFLSQAYLDFLGRDATSEELAPYIETLQSGEQTLDKQIMAIMNSPEATDFKKGTALDRMAAIYGSGGKAAGGGGGGSSGISYGGTPIRDFDFTPFGEDTDVELSPGMLAAEGAAEEQLTDPDSVFQQLLNAEPNFGLFEKAVIEPLHRQYGETVQGLKEQLGGQGLFSGQRSEGMTDLAGKLLETESQLRYQEADKAKDRSLQAMQLLPTLQAAASASYQADIRNLENRMRVHYGDAELASGLLKADLDFTARMAGVGAQMAGVRAKMMSDQLNYQLAIDQMGMQGQQFYMTWTQDQEQWDQYMDMAQDQQGHDQTMDIFNTFLGLGRTAASIYTMGGPPGGSPAPGASSGMGFDTGYGSGYGSGYGFGSGLS